MNSLLGHPSWDSSGHSRRANSPELKTSLYRHLGVARVWGFSGLSHLPAFLNPSSSASDPDPTHPLCAELYHSTGTCGLGLPACRSLQLGMGVNAAQPWAPAGVQRAGSRLSSNHCPLGRSFFSLVAGQSPLEYLATMSRGP